MTGLTRVLVGSTFAVASLITAHSADAAAPYFEGKHVTMTISNSPGGGMDATARAIANLLRRYLPGEPTMVVSNRPGGNHIVGNNWFAAMAARDGTDFLYTASSIVDQFNRGGESIKFDPKDYIYILSMKLGEEVVFVRNEAYDRVYDLSKPPVVVGDVDGIRTQVAVTSMAKRFLKQNYRWTVGYPGGNELQLAFQKGEIEVLGTKNQTAIDQVINGGYGKPILQSSKHRRPDFKDTPTVWELVDKVPNVPPLERAAFEFWTGADSFDHILALPPKTDPAVVTMYREAAAKMVKDPDFRKLVAAVMGPSIVENSGEETGKMMITATTATKEVKDTLKKIRVEYGLPTGE